jgi:hypothetical protein
LSSTPQKFSSDHTQPVNIGRLIIKATLLFVVLNMVFAFFYPMTFLGRISAYNILFPGRSRLPYGDNPQKSYNLNLYNLEAMFASQEIHRAEKGSDEFRVILIGDSATWGFLLSPDQTTSAFLNQSNFVLPDGRHIRAYNLGYPVMSLTKDLLVLSQAMTYAPDLIVWAVTLESFPYDKQLFPPLLQNNANLVRNLIQQHRINLNPDSSDLIDLNLWDRTIIGSRRPLADLIRLQLYGVMWAATGIDHEIPDSYSPAQQDLTNELSFHGLQPPHLDHAEIAIDILETGFEIAGDTPILLVNEPMLISQGQNSDLRYNYFYPRWAYDDYRQLLNSKASDQDWHYVDFWDAIPAHEFTNSAVHLSPVGSQLYADLLLQAILDLTKAKVPSGD